jgi:hypothetical protein
MRSRVAATRDNGICASGMLFNGFSIEGKGNVSGSPWQEHPFNPMNNVNGIDGGEWKPVGEAVTWTPTRRGAIRQEVKTANQFGVDGPVSTAEIVVEADAKAAPRAL